MSERKARERRDANMLEFTRDARRSSAGVPVLTTRRTIEMEGLSLDLHVLKHLLRPRERWDEVVGFEIPQGAKFERARLMARQTQVTEGIWNALQQLSPEAPLAAVERLCAALLKDEIEWVKSRRESSSLVDVQAAISGIELAYEAGAAQPVVQLVPGHEEEAAKRWENADREYVEELCTALEVDAYQPLSSEECQLAGELRRRASGTKPIELVRLVRRAEDPSMFESRIRAEVDEIERERPGLRDAYRAAIARALADAGTAPRHCVYDRAEARGNECYIDDDGITVCQSRERKGEIYRVRTAYRVPTGRTPAERRLEASEAAAFRRRIEPTKAVKDFKKARIQQAFTEERWLHVD